MYLYLYIQSQKSITEGFLFVNRITFFRFLINKSLTTSENLRKRCKVSIQGYEIKQCFFPTIRFFADVGHFDISLMVLVITHCLFVFHLSVLGHLQRMQT